MDAINAKIMVLRMYIGEIATATHEQAVAISEVNGSVSQLDAVNQHKMWPSAPPTHIIFRDQAETVRPSSLPILAIAAFRTSIGLSFPVM